MKRLDRLESKVDQILDVQGDIKGDLREHMRRTELLEKKVEILEPAIGLFKGVVWLGVICGAVYAVIRLMSALTP